MNLIRYQASSSFSSMNAENPGPNAEAALEPEAIDAQEKNPENSKRPESSTEQAENEPTIDTLADEYQQNDTLQERVEDLQESSQQTADDIKRQRKVLDLPGDGVENFASQTAFQEAQRNLERQLAETRQLEDEFLDAPEGEPSTSGKNEGQEAMSEDLRQQIENVEQMVEKSEEEMKVARQESIRKWIEATKEEMLEHFRTDLGESRNGEAAAALIALKAGQSLWNGSKEFIENGKNTPKAVRVRISFSTFPSADESADPSGEAKYITGVDAWSEDAYEPSAPEATEPKKRDAPLVPEEGQQAIEDAEKAGTLDKEEKK
jgi:hypothetical protein